MDNWDNVQFDGTHGPFFVFYAEFDREYRTGFGDRGVSHDRRGRMHSVAWAETGRADCCGFSFPCVPCVRCFPDSHSAAELEDLSEEGCQPGECVFSFSRIWIAFGIYCGYEEASEVGECGRCAQ